MNGSPHPRVTELRKLLDQKLPLTRRPRVRKAHAWSTGIKPLDHALGGGMAPSTMVELVGCGKSCGTGLVVRSLVLRLQAEQKWGALIDGSDSFDAASVGTLPRLLWLRCRDAAQALKAADLILRDGNMSLAVLDLFLNPVAQLHKIPASTWYRFQRIVEDSGTGLMVITPCRVVAPARLSLQLTRKFDLTSLDEPESKLLTSIKIRVEIIRGRDVSPTLPQVAEAG